LQARPIGAREPSVLPPISLASNSKSPYIKLMKTSKPLLSIRVRKLLGLFGLLLLLFVYALIVMTIAVSGRVPQDGAAEFFFYLITGLAWTPPAAAIIWWMQRPD
tara:strand:+ start:22 stop:336 length:315 start_codon:yes stop_codon:yes gene_type:complete